MTSTQPTNEMAASLKRDGFGADEIANMCGPDVEQQPIQLRWGLDDVQWGDDDSVIVMLSGPDGEPYWLELDQERAAALRQSLAGPDGEPDAVPAVDPATDRAALRERVIVALENAHHTHPCPALGDQIWSGCVHYDEAGRVAGVGSCHSGRRADAVLAVLPASVDRAAVLEEAAGLAEDVALKRHRQHEIEREQGALDVMTELRRVAAETPGEAEPWRSDSARIGRALIWSWTDVGKGAFGEGYRAAQAEARTLLGGQRGAGADAPAGGAQQPKETRP